MWDCDRRSTYSVQLCSVSQNRLCALTPMARLDRRPILRDHPLNREGWIRVQKAKRATNKGGQRGNHSEVVAEALGMTTEELREAVADGQTIA